jgi:hypothetical protein
MNPNIIRPEKIIINLRKKSGQNLNNSGLFPPKPHKIDKIVRENIRKIKKKEELMELSKLKQKEGRIIKKEELNNYNEDVRNQNAKKSTGRKKRSSSCLNKAAANAIGKGSFADPNTSTSAVGQTAPTQLKKKGIILGDNNQLSSQMASVMAIKKKLK